MIALLISNWRLSVAALFGAALCWPVASCQGERRADATNAQKVIAAAAKVREAAAKAELAATMADVVRKDRSAKAVQELRDIVNEKGTVAPAGPGVTGVLERLRRNTR